MRTGIELAAVPASRFNLDDHQSSVFARTPSRAPNAAAVSPLAFHRATRFCHVFAVSVIGAHSARSRSITPGRSSCSGYGKDASKIADGIRQQVSAAYRGVRVIAVDSKGLHHITHHTHQQEHRYWHDVLHCSQVAPRTWAGTQPGWTIRVMIGLLDIDDARCGDGCF
jgi:hypothetical protein